MAPSCPGVICPRYLPPPYGVGETPERLLMVGVRSGYVLPRYEFNAFCQPFQSALSAASSPPRCWRVFSSPRAPAPASS